MKVPGHTKVFERTNVIVGAYATAPSLVNWGPQKEVDYLRRIYALPGIDGLEVPFWGEGFCRYDESVLLNQIPSEWNNVVTVIPGIMSLVLEDPTFGLASESEEGRSFAIELMEKVRRKIIAVVNAYPNFRCNLVSFCSAPITELSPDSKDRFKRSLQEIVRWDWGESQLVVEHCDEYRQNGSHQKGSMSLEDELMVLKDVQDQKDVDTRLGITINWGRSVIEGRDVKTPVEHIRVAKKAGLLRGLMFSGVSKAGPYGVWSDTHAPPREVILDNTYNDELLLDHGKIASCVSQIGDEPIEYIGIKIGAQPDNISITERCRLNAESLLQLKSC